MRKNLIMCKIARKKLTNIQYITYFFLQTRTARLTEKPSSVRSNAQLGMVETFCQG